MARTDFKSNEYIASTPEKVQSTLKQVRSAIRKAVPGAEEGISYQLPRTN
jgi:uncharacterized protein YdhG (YjbR/CyaY superfamily)